MKAKKICILMIVALLGMTVVACRLGLDTPLGFVGYTNEEPALVAVDNGDEAPPPPPAAAPAAEGLAPEGSLTGFNCDKGDTTFAIPQGETRLVRAGCRVSGDVQIGTSPNGPFTRLYDDDGDTGLVVDMASDGYVYAPEPGGASVNSDSIQTWTVNMTRSGCTKMCKVVVAETWPLDP